KKHKKDRPYPLSGGMFDPNTPWGWAGNMTIGRILKPRIDYGAGATKADLEQQREEASYDGVNIAMYTGGEFEVSTYVPQGNVGSSSGGISANMTGGNIQTYGNMVPGTATGTGSYISQSEIEGTNAEIMMSAQAGGTTNGRKISQQEIGEINSSIKNMSGESRYVDKESLNSTGYMLPYREPMVNEEPDGDVQDPRSLSYGIKQGVSLFQDIFGARGFLAGLPFGNDQGAGEKVLDTADSAYAGTSRFWNLNLGGLGGNLSEAGRRLINSPNNRIHRVNNIPNMMPDWLPGEDYFTNYQIGDPYAKIGMGEIRLPGEAYESLHQLHPDEWGRYGAVDRAAILADVAPWSQEYKFWLKVAREQGLDKDEKAFLKRALERTKKQTDNLHLTPYKFINNNLKKENAKIEKFIDSNRFTLMGSNQVFRLAGVHNSFNSETQSGMKALRVLEKNMMPGQEVTLVYNKHDKKDSTPAVVYANSQNVNKLLIEQGVTKREESGPISSYVDMNFLSRSAGYAWETIAHSRIPVIQNKILNVNSPMEHYKNFGLYGKDFQNWQEPIEDFVVPEFQSAIARHPFSAALTMTSVGGVTGWLIAGKKGAKVGAAIGAASGIIGSLGRIAHEIESGKAWIPKRRQKERDINEYFDRLKYLKYKRLYNKYSELAKIKEDVDLESTIKKFERLDKHINDEQEKAKNTVEKIRRTGLHHGSSVRKIINKNGRIEHKLVTDKGYLSKVSSEMTEEINELQNKSYLVGLGPYAKKAVEYRQKYKSTLYSVDEENTNMQSIMRALPKKDREYFKNFIKTTDPEQRKEILRLVPEDQKRAYQILWGMNPNKKEDMASYFKDHYLPDDSWIGWKEGIDLEDAQIKTIENQGLDEKDFGIWKDHTEDEYLTPGPAPANIGYDKRNVDIFSIRKELHQILEEYDLKDIEIEIEPNKNSGISIDLQVMHNREAEIEEKIVNVLGA
ncbi:MAG: thermonuclease family protein, partial [Halanaerobiales bacterium]